MTSHGLAASGDWSESDQPSEDRQPLTISRRRNRIMDTATSEFDRVRPGNRAVYRYAVLSGKCCGQVTTPHRTSYPMPPRRNITSLVYGHRACPSQFCVQELLFTGIALHKLFVCQSGRPIDVNQRLSASICSICQVIPGAPRPITRWNKSSVAEHARDGVNPPIPLKPPKNSHPPEPDRKTQSHQ